MRRGIVERDDCRGALPFLRCLFHRDPRGDTPVIQPPFFRMPAIDVPLFAFTHRRDVPGVVRRQGRTA